MLLFFLLTKLINASKEQIKSISVDEQIENVEDFLRDYIKVKKTTILLHDLKVKVEERGKQDESFEFEHKCKKSSKCESLNFECGNIEKAVSCFLHSILIKRTQEFRAFDGDVKLWFSSIESRIDVHHLYVADQKPEVSGAEILNMVVNLVDSWGSEWKATLLDNSNVEALTMLTKGKTYYEHARFESEDEIAEDVRKFPGEVVDVSEVRHCMNIRYSSFNPTEFTDEILSNFAKNLPSKSNMKLEEFWDVYKDTMKVSDVYVPNDAPETKSQRSVKQTFPSFLFECLFSEAILKKTPDESFFAKKKDEKIPELIFIRLPNGNFPIYRTSMDSNLKTFNTCQRKMQAESEAVFADTTKSSYGDVLEKIETSEVVCENLSFESFVRDFLSIVDFKNKLPTNMIYKN